MLRSPPPGEYCFIASVDILVRSNVLSISPKVEGLALVGALAPGAELAGVPGCAGVREIKAALALLTILSKNSSPVLAVAKGFPAGGVPGGVPVAGSVPAGVPGGVPGLTREFTKSLTLLIVLE